MSKLRRKLIKVDKLNFFYHISVFPHAHCLCISSVYVQALDTIRLVNIYILQQQLSIDAAPKLERPLSVLYIYLAVYG